MPARRFIQVDVFTDTPFCGNPLAVILDGQGLTGEQMQAITPDLGALHTICQRYDTHSIYAFTRETVTSSAHVHSRLFAPLAGVFEDPATGSASGALGAYLVHYRVFGGDMPVVHLENEQGYELGRPSRILIEVVQDGSTLSSVRVGGHVVKVIDGTVYV
jgi:trans-2,3-dihydro-3-hydroxyanthranilate isomerase